MNRETSITENKENFNDNMNNGEGKKKTHTKTLVAGNLEKNGNKSNISHNDNSGLLNNPLNDKLIKKSQVKKTSNILLKKSEEQITQIIKNSQIITENLPFLAVSQNQNHNQEVKKNIKEEEDLSFCLNHKISPEIRTKMVDWMIEVISVYKSETETLFLSVAIMDLFINRWPNTIRSDEIHIIGMTSMFIASKFEDLLPIRMSSLVSKIGHNIFNE